MRANMILPALILLGLLSGGCGKSETKTISLQTASETSKSPSTGTPTNLVAKIHFVGTTALMGDTNAARLKEIADLPATAEVREQMMERLATAPYRLFQKKLAPNSKDEAALIRPLIEDLFKQESYVEARGTNSIPEVILAVHLSDERADAWRTNLAAVLSSWTGLPVKEIEVDGFKGWELKKHENPDIIRFIRANEWVLFGWGQDKILLQPGMVDRIKKENRPTASAVDHWLHAWIDWPALASTWSNSYPMAMPKTDITLANTKDYLRTKVLMDFPESLNLVLEPWQVPTNIIRDPLVSFSAARGIEPWLKQLKQVHALNLEKLPNQFYLWAMAKIPFETSVVAPVKDGTNFMDKLCPAVVNEFNPLLKERNIGELNWNTNQNQVLWTGIPLLSPYMKLYADPAGEFIKVGVFPSPMRKAPPPAELLNELTSRTNLVYYGWEITQERLPQVRSLAEFFYIISGRGLAGPDAPTQKWLDAVAPKLGNCGTVVTMTSPKELTLVRNSPVGFTAFELTMLKRWLDSPHFPLDTKFERAKPQLKSRTGQPSSGIPVPALPSPAATTDTNQVK